MTTDEKRIQAITAAVAAAFADTDCTLDPHQVKAIVDAEWKAQTERTMRALISR